MIIQKYIAIFYISFSIILNCVIEKFWIAEYKMIVKISEYQNKMCKEYQKNNAKDNGTK